MRAAQQDRQTQTDRPEVILNLARLLLMAEDLALVLIPELVVLADQGAADDLLLVVTETLLLHLHHKETMVALVQLPLPITAVVEVVPLASAEMEVLQKAATVEQVYRLP